MTDGLLHAAWDRMIVRELCDGAIVTPLIFCVGDEKAIARHRRQQEQADAMFEDIMSSPEKIQQAVAGYSRFLREQRIAHLEDELSSLKECDGNEV